MLHLVVAGTELGDDDVGIRISCKPARCNWWDQYIVGRYVTWWRHKYISSVVTWYSSSVCYPPHSYFNRWSIHSILVLSALALYSQVYNIPESYLQEWFTWVLIWQEILCMLVWQRFPCPSLGHTNSPTRFQVSNVWGVWHCLLTCSGWPFPWRQTHCS